MRKIVLVAPSLEIQNYGERLIQEEHVKNLEIYKGNVTTAEKIAKGFDPLKVDAIISRGNTASTLQANVNIPVIFIPITPDNYVDAIEQAEKLANGSNVKIAIIGMEDTLRKFGPILTAFNQNIQIYPGVTNGVILQSIERAKNDHIDYVIGGAFTVKSAIENGIPAVEIRSSYELVKAAYTQACKVAEVAFHQKEHDQEVNIIFNMGTDAILVVNQDLKISTYNHNASELFHLSNQNMASLDHLFPETEIAFFRKTQSSGKPAKYHIVKLNHTTYSMSIYPINIDDRPGRFVVFLAKVNDLQNEEKKLRKKLYFKGNVAHYTFSDIKGNSTALKKTIQTAETFAPLHSNILLIGQTGVGKEMFAQAIHNESLCKDGPFVAVNCGSIPEELLESELFGYTAGAFTGASKEGKPGYFELAHNGTIFLDEISEMSFNAQVRLLRVLQEKQIRRLGSEEVLPVNVRIIAASNSNLQRLVEEGKFRKDLYYRLCVLVLHIPSLNDRGNDISLLAEYFLQKYNNEFGKNCRFTSDAKNVLQHLSWEGNVRQLRHFCERLCATCNAAFISDDFVKENYHECYSYSFLEKTAHFDTENIAETKNIQKNESIHPKTLTPEYIEDLLVQYDGNKTLLAKRLGISRTTLWKYLKKPSSL